VASVISSVRNLCSVSVEFRLNALQAAARKSTRFFQFTEYKTNLPGLRFTIGYIYDQLSEYRKERRRRRRRWRRRRAPTFELQPKRHTSRRLLSKMRAQVVPTTIINPWTIYDAGWPRRSRWTISNKPLPADSGVPGIKTTWNHRAPASLGSSSMARSPGPGLGSRESVGGGLVLMWWWGGGGWNCCRQMFSPSEWSYYIL